MVEKWNSVGGTVERYWWNSGPEMVLQHGETVEQWWWNSVVEQWNGVGGTTEQ